MLVTGTVLWFTKYSLKADGNKKNLGVLDALIVGTVQGLAITPEYHVLAQQSPPPLSGSW